MNCQQAQNQLTALELGELEGRRFRSVETHLTACEGCRQARLEHRALSGLLAGYVPPVIPDGFEAALQDRLRSTPAPAAVENELPTRPGSWWRATAKAAALVAAGIVIGALGLWVAGSERAGSGDAGLQKPTPTQAPSASPAVRLRRGEVAVVTLVVHVKNHHPAAALEVVLPDGVALVGEGLVQYEEKQLRWSESLKPGANQIRVPVRALREGRWQVVARVRSGALRTSSRVRLQVTPS